jgi:hypothetical protein
MNTQASTGWGSRSKRTTVIALALVAVIAGVAVAYFLTSAKFAGNKALGGTLTVDATLPMDFSDETLYPTSPDPAGPAVGSQPWIDRQVNGAPESDFYYAEKEFTIDNNNPVDVTYELYATCEECIPDPADTPEQAAARADKADQFNNLWVNISGGASHTGRLADMTPTNPLSLGEISGDGGSETYTVRLWLQNDPNRAQPQGVESIWEFFVNAKTPA